LTWGGTRRPKAKKATSEKAPVEAIKPEPEPAAAAKKSPTEKKAKVAAEESDEEPEEAEVVTGAMDGFVGATKKTKKKLVEKNFMDDKGYLGELLQVLTPQSVHTRTRSHTRAAL
jgi:hypothetical protein